MPKNINQILAKNKWLLEEQKNTSSKSIPDEEPLRIVIPSKPLYVTRSTEPPFNEDLIDCPRCKQHTAVFCSIGVHGEVYWCDNKKCQFIFNTVRYWEELGRMPETKSKSRHGKKANNKGRKK